jgi:hypothetical protein
MFCHTSLGKNEAIEHFPVGRRLAFDAAKGRLWAVCRECERWNLSPLDERWEAIEECEQLFRDTKLRVSTDNIGLARLKEGTTLVRVGDPQRPEMAAWRYGDQFHRRRRRHYAMFTAGAVVVGGVIMAGPVMGLFGGVGTQLAIQGTSLIRQRTIARVPVNGTVLKLNQPMLKKVVVGPDEAGGIKIEFPHKPFDWRKQWTGWRKYEGLIELAGDEAISAARHLLPRINQSGGSSHDVAEAVKVLEQTRGDEPFGRFASIAKAYGDSPASVASLDASARLALEMSLHEDDERQALEGELALLEDRWREAEEVAAISDDMFLPSGVNEMLARIKNGG